MHMATISQKLFASSITRIGGLARSFVARSARLGFQLEKESFSRDGRCKRVMGAPMLFEKSHENEKSLLKY